MIGQLHARIACLQPMLLCLSAPDWLFTNRCLTPIDVSSNFGIAQAVAALNVRVYPAKYFINFIQGLFVPLYM